MRRFWRKGIAILEAVTMTAALFAGISFGTTKDIQAATDGTLTVNEPVAVSCAEGSSISYSFVAPEADTYYFTSTGECDVKGELYIDDIICGEDDDGGERTNFRIEAQLDKGQECVIKVTGYDNIAFECNLIAYNSENAKTITSDFAAEEMHVYCDEGESITFKVIAYNLAGDIVEAEEEYTVQWQKLIISEADTVSEALDGTGFTYTIDSAGAEDFSEQVGYRIAYEALIYKNDEHVNGVTFYLNNKEEQFHVYGSTYRVKKGESITLTPEILDYDGNEIDTSGSEYTFKWYKYADDGYNIIPTELECTEKSYTIDSIDETDFYEQEDGTIEFCVEVYKNGKSIGAASFDLRNVEDEIYAEESEYIVSEGESVTLTPKVFDYYGNEIETFGSEYRFEWYKGIIVDNFYDRVEIEATEASYTIDSVSAADFYEQEEGYFLYSVDIFINNVYKATAAIRLLDRAEYIVASGNQYTVAQGDRVTLTPEVRDADGKVVDVSGSEYTFKWCKIVGMAEIGEQRIDLETTELSHTIDSVTAEDFSFYIINDGGIAQARFRVEIYKAGKLKTTADFYLNEREEGETPTTPVVEPTTPVVEPTTPVEQPTTPTVKPTTAAPTTVAPTTKKDTKKVKKPAQAKIKKATRKKKASKTVNLTLKKIKRAKGYQVQISKSKKFTKKNILVKKNVKKLKVSVTSKKLKSKKKLYVRVRAYVLDSKKKKVYGKWSKVKKVTIKK